jgi:hypothetical protein
MLGFRGASRYYHPKFADSFKLECVSRRACPAASLHPLPAARARATLHCMHLFRLVKVTCVLLRTACARTPRPLRCEAMKIVRERMGLRNVELLVPFVRTVEEGRRVVDLMGELGLARGTGADCVKVYFMCEARERCREADTDR